jgi:hypothetical protein
MSDYDTQDPQASTDWFSKIGGVLGGPRDDTVAPIIGQEGLQNARNNALLNFGIGMLNAAGWHPHKVTLGQAFAEGAQGAQGAYQNSLDNSIKSASSAQALQMGRLQMGQRLALIQAAAPILARIRAATGGATPGAQPDMAANPFAQGATPGAAGGAGAMPVPAAAAGAGAAGMPSPMSAQGGGAAAAPIAAPLAQRAQLTSALKDYQMLGGLLDAPNARGVAAAFAPSIPEYKQLDDGTIVDMHDPSVNGSFHGKLFDGKAVLTPNGVQLRPGVVDAERQLADIGARSKAQYDYSVHGMTPGGVPYVTTPVGAPGAANQPPPIPTLPGLGGGAPAAGGAAPMPNGPAPGSAPAPAAGGAPAAAPQDLPPGAVQTGMSPVADALNKGGGEALQKEIVSSSTAAKDAPMQLQVLARNDQLLRQTGANAGAPAALAVGKYLQSIGVLSAKDSTNIDKIQELYNNEANAVMGQLKATFPGRITNADLQFAIQTMAGKGQSATAARVLNGINAAKVLNAQEYQKFVSNYAQQAKAGLADPNGLTSAWIAHEQQQPSIWETPMLLNSGALTTKQNKQGATLVNIPGRGWLPVTRTQSGMLAPATQ